MTTKVRFHEADIRQACRDYTGFCIVCGAARDCCEPDARNDYCEACDDNGVYGAEEILLMGLVDTDGEAADV